MPPFCMPPHPIRLSRMLWTKHFPTTNLPIFIMQSKSSFYYLPKHILLRNSQNLCLVSVSDNYFLLSAIHHFVRFVRPGSHVCKQKRSPHNKFRHTTVGCGLALASDSALRDHVTASAPVLDMSVFPLQACLVPSALPPPPSPCNRRQVPCPFHIPTHLTSNLATDDTRIAQSCQHNVARRLEDGELGPSTTALSDKDHCL